MMRKEEHEQRRFAKRLHKTTVQALRAGLSEKKNKQKEEQQMRKWWAERKAFVAQSENLRFAEAQAPVKLPLQHLRRLWVLCVWGAPSLAPVQLLELCVLNFQSVSQFMV